MIKLDVEYWATTASKETLPEEKLLLAVLAQAIHDISEAFTRGFRKEHKDAWDWFLSDDQSSPFSFLPICNHFGLRPEAVLRRIFDPSRWPKLKRIWRAQISFDGKLIKLGHEESLTMTSADNDLLSQPLVGLMHRT